MEAVTSGLGTADRGKLIMACGTGKTFTSLKIAEHMAGHSGRGGRVLFLVPSLSLLSQTRPGLGGGTPVRENRQR